MTGHEFQALASSFAGTTAAAHFDRTAFKARRIFATLAADGCSANLLLTPDEQEHYATLQPGAFCRVPNKWGDQGWTTVTLAEADADLVRTALESAWQAAYPAPKPRSVRKR
ncbi:MmcQ/YjbR family DNA-binding protein [Bradyrhizobium sp. SRS-191]|uniref:MmcQ/YjbR family DNA-binding protein n=1 Tax=Bradyrhizobium sp. SRS-191 TaxID=2962606 RepID=UPI00211E2EB8|nr:MmcQ/YjbR family DNA-binding protein [Bradyrhizobium sp. SRS-191]